MSMNPKHLNELSGLITKAKTPAQAQELLKDLLTKRELASVCERVQIFKALLNKMPHRKISKSLKLSISKVTRGSHALKKSKSLIKKAL